MLKKFVFSLTAIITLSLVVIAQDNTVTVTGTVVDKACSARMANQEAAANHGTSCVLMDSCLKSGLGIYADGKFTAFTENSVALAKAALEKSKKDKGAVFKVTGKMDGDTLTVKEITEVLK